MLESNLCSDLLCILNFVYIAYCLVPLGTSPFDTPHALGASLFKSSILLHQILQASRMCITV